MKRNPTAGLQTVSVLLSVFGALLFFVALPRVGVHYASRYPQHAKYFWPTLAYAWVIALLCYAALWQFVKITREIRRDNTFSLNNARSIQIIARCSFVCAAWLLIGAVVLWRIQLMFMTLALIFLCAISFFAVLSTLAHSLSRLTRRAAEIKRENDLTI